jgi:uncharacterized protein (DUF983 family)
MNYRCPQCSHKLQVRTLFLNDISACSQCGQKVLLGDFFAFFVAALAMSVAALSSLYVLSHEVEDYWVAAAWALSIGMISGLVVLALLGRAVPAKRFRARRNTQAGALGESAVHKG